MEFSQYSELFLSESREHISSINHLLLALEENPGGREPVEGVFRAVHTIKGMSATMGYRSVADLSHELENLLDQVRMGTRDVDAALVDVLFAGADALERTIELAVTDREGEFDSSEVLDRLRRTAAGSTAPAPPAAAPAASAAVPAPAAAPTGPAAAPGDRSGGLRIELVVDRNSPLPGVRAFLALKKARDFGEVSEVDPAEDILTEESFGGTVHFFLRTEEDPAKVQEVLLQAGEIERVVVEAATARPEPAAAPAADAGAEDATRMRSIRVDLRRLDALMNEVGELVILRDRLVRLAAGNPNAELEDAIDQAARLVSELQDEIMRIRMVPVAQVFDRFPRLVRDAARNLGKRVNFVIEGKEIEFDRSMLDELGDPLVHLLRNSLDHGVESPEERLSIGKPEAGTLRLTASRERSRAVIRVEDDGRGIRRGPVIAKAISTGLVTADAAANLTDEEVYRLLMQPGFSTAERITDVSGRGVGLDVVGTRVRGLGGTLEITSEEGHGTTFTLRLPLTLAIVHSLLVRVGEETYAVPLAHVGETTEFSHAEIRAVAGRPVVLLREEVIPLLRLREILEYDEVERSGLVSVVVLEMGEQRVGLEVDALVGQQEIVVKSFDSTADTLRLFSGATILSDGRPALILDAGSLAHHAPRTDATRVA